jgi:hypothetical protein
VTKGFVNLNRFKYGRAIKQRGKRKPDLQRKKKSEGERAKFHGQNS